MRQQLGLRVQQTPQAVVTQCQQHAQGAHDALHAVGCTSGIVRVGMAESAASVQAYKAVASGLLAQER